jgi:regulator of protease activity HflC (stomatin/prohibitin superfamily)
MIPFNSIVLFGIAFFLLVVLLRTIKIVPQKQVKLIERLGKYHRTAEAGLNTIVPFLDSVRATIDLREQITKIEPQPVITRDNVTMEVDAVIYYLVADPVRATYEVQNLPWGLEQLTLSALRNVIGQLDLDHTLSSRDSTNTQLRAALDSATQQWGVKVMRIELKNITPPEEIRLTMEKQMTAERTRRAVVTTAEGEKSSAILRAEGQKQSQIVNAEGAKEAAILAGRVRPRPGCGSRRRKPRPSRSSRRRSARLAARRSTSSPRNISRRSARFQPTRRSSCSCRMKRAASWRRSAVSKSCFSRSRIAP